MSQNNSNDKAAMLAKIEGINKVDGFDPTPFAVDYTDLETGEVRKRLPVMIQMAWFRMKYPEGRIAITVSPGKDCFVATGISIVVNADEHHAAVRICESDHFFINYLSKLSLEFYIFGFKVHGDASSYEF